MGGAAAGILGSSGADSDVLNKLKKTALVFASEYNKPTIDRAILERLSNEIDGLLQTLQVVNTLSEEDGHKLIEQLQNLMDIA